MPKNGDASSSRGDPLNKKVEIPPRSTTPDGEPPPSRLDFATMHRTGTIPGGQKDFASRQGFKRDRSMQSDMERLEKLGLHGKVRVLEPYFDDKYKCHELTFFNGRNKRIPKEDLKRYIEKDFKLLKTKDEYKSNPSLYEDLADRLKKDKEENEGHILHYIAVYRKDGGGFTHSTPIGEVYQKEDGTLSINVWGKWGRGRSLFTHDIEDVTPTFKDKGEAKWEIRVTDRPNGRIMDL